MTKVMPYTIINKSMRKMKRLQAENVDILYTTDVIRNKQYIKCY
jgi:hypothetical protein